MANLIWIYNGSIPDFKNPNNRAKFGPCYKIFRTINMNYHYVDGGGVGHKCFLLVNVSARPNDSDFDLRNKSVQAWKYAHAQKIIRVPIVILDLTMFLFEREVILFDSDYICSPDIEQRIEIVKTALEENNLMNDFFHFFMRGIPSAGHHIAKVITVKNFLSIFARFVFGGCTVDSSVVPHIVNGNDITNMKGLSSDYARMELDGYPSAVTPDTAVTAGSTVHLKPDDYDERVAMLISNFLNQIDAENVRSGVPVPAYNFGGFPSALDQMVRMWYHPRDLINFPAGRMPILAKSLICPENKKILYPISYHEWDILYNSTLRHLEHYKSLLEAETRARCSIMSILTRIDIFFNSAPHSFPGTLFALIVHVCNTRSYPASTAARRVKLGEYNRARASGEVPPVYAEHAWHIDTPTPPSDLKSELFSVSKRQKVTYLAEGLYFPTLYQIIQNPDSPRYAPELVADPSWNSLGVGIYVVFLSNGLPTGLVKIVNQAWNSPVGSDRDPPISPLGNVYPRL